MKAVAVNGSHRAGKSTSHLLRGVLDGLESRGWDVDLVELATLDIAYCRGCNACLLGKACLCMTIWPISSMPFAMPAS